MAFDEKPLMRVIFYGEQAQDHTDLTKKVGEENCVECTTSEEFAEAINAEQPSLALLNLSLGMAEIDALNLAVAEQGASTKRILLSDPEQKEDLLGLLKNTDVAEAFFVKPVSDSLLIEVVNSFEVLNEVEGTVNRGKTQILDLSKLTDQLNDQENADLSNVLVKETFEEHNSAEVNPAFENDLNRRIQALFDSVFESSDAFNPGSIRMEGDNPDENAGLDLEQAESLDFSDANEMDLENPEPQINNSNEDMQMPSIDQEEQDMADDNKNPDELGENSGISLTNVDSSELEVENSNSENAATELEQGPEATDLLESEGELNLDNSLSGADLQFDTGTEAAEELTFEAEPQIGETTGDLPDPAVLEESSDLSEVSLDQGAPLDLSSSDIGGELSFETPGESEDLSEASAIEEVADQKSEDEITELTDHSLSIDGSEDLAISTGSGPTTTSDDPDATVVADLSGLFDGPMPSSRPAEESEDPVDEAALHEALFSDTDGQNGEDPDITVAMPSPVDSVSIGEPTETPDVHSAPTPESGAGEQKFEYRSFVQNKQAHDDIIAHHDNEIVKLSATIRNLREDRDKLLHQISSLEEERDRLKQENITHKADLDDSKIENSILKKRFAREREVLEYDLKLTQDKLLASQERNKEHEFELRNLDRKVQVDLKKIRQRENELEGKLELLKSDAESQILNREQKIVELKRRIDTLEFDMESMGKIEKQSKENSVLLEEKLDRVMKTLKLAMKMLDDSNYEKKDIKGNPPDLREAN